AAGRRAPGARAWRGLCLAGRDHPAGARPWRVERGCAAGTLRRLRPEPRPDRQPRLRRAAVGAGPAGTPARGDGPGRADPDGAAVLHGRTLGGARALPVLHRLPGATGRGRARRPPPRVRALRRLRQCRGQAHDSRSQRGLDLRGFARALAGRGRCPGRGVAGLVRRTARPARPRAGAAPGPGPATRGARDRRVRRRCRLAAGRDTVVDRTEPRPHHASQRPAAGKRPAAHRADGGGRAAAGPAARAQGGPMSGGDASLHALAEAAGLCREWTDVSGRPQVVSDATLHGVLAAMDLPAVTVAQRRDSLHRLQAVQAEPPLVTARPGTRIAVGGGPGLRQWESEDGEREDARVDARGRVRVPLTPGYWTLHDGAPRRVAVAPDRCFGVEDAVPEGRAWGVALQVYSARTSGDGGIGDTAGCSDWVRRLAAAGGDALALSPVHAALEGAGYYSPYAPSDRRCLDPLHASPSLVFGEVAEQALEDDPGLRPRLRELESARFVDWAAARPAKWAWLRRLHAHGLALRPDLQADFARFAAAPPPEVAAYVAFTAGDDEDAAQLHLFGQWLARTAWAQCQRQARGAGLGIGLVADLAVGFDPSGSEAAASPSAVLRG